MSSSSPICVAPLLDLPPSSATTSPLRWGVLGCGRVSNDFCLAAHSAFGRDNPSIRITACASASSESSARGFADRHGIARAYGSYAELADDGEIDVVYVGTVHHMRLSVASMVIAAGKHLVLEKPFALCLDDARTIVQMARKAGVFCMEGMWTRFFPVLRHVDSILKSGDLGAPVQLTSGFHFNTEDSEKYPDSPLYNFDLAGGAAMYVAPYPLHVTAMVLGCNPTSVKAVGRVDSGTGVDLQASVSLGFAAVNAPQAEVGEKARPRPNAGALASIHYGFLTESGGTTIFCEGGKIIIHEPSHCPTSFRVDMKLAGRGEKETKTFDYSLPPVVGDVGDLQYNYPNSAGFAYEAAAVCRHIAAGLTEAPECNLDDTLEVMKQLDEIRGQIGMDIPRESGSK